MLSTGIVSITFRNLSVGEIAELASKAGVEGVEWGGDVHVPQGNITKAGEARTITADAGLQVAAYGSYYRTGTSEREGLSFNSVLDTACELQAPLIRVWAGRQGSADADDAARARVVDDTRRIADMAESRGISIAFEFHTNTLTDTNESALKLLQEVNHPNVKTYWQRPNDRSFNYALAGLHMVLPWLSNIHVFHWVNRERRALEEGEQDWLRFLPCIMNENSSDHWAMIEFVKDDNLSAFLADATVLKRLLALQA